VDPLRLKSLGPVIYWAVDHWAQTAGKDGCIWQVPRFFCRLCRLSLRTCQCGWAPDDGLQDRGRDPHWQHIMRSHPPCSPSSSTSFISASFILIRQVHLFQRLCLQKRKPFVKASLVTNCLKASVRSFKRPLRTKTVVVASAVHVGIFVFT
jgi:hypothetical protein